MVIGHSLAEVTNTLSALQTSLERNGFGYPNRTFYTMDEIVDDRAVLDQLEQLSHRLDSFSHAVKKKIEWVQHKISRPASNHAAILSLPTEILGYIIEIVATEKDRDKYRFRQTKVTIEDLSLVSRMFRHVVINTASLWSRLDRVYCLSRDFETCIERSGNTPIVMYLDLDHEPKWEPILSRALPYSHRFRKMLFDVEKKAEQVATLHPHISFPRLEDARLIFNTGNNFGHFFAHWSFPAVKRLAISHAIPSPGQFTSLTSFALLICTDSFEQVYTRITPFLNNLHNLQTLSLKLPSSFDQDVETMELSPASLPTVTSLVISNFDGHSIGFPETALAVGQLFKAIKVPNASDVCLEVGHLDEEEIHVWFQMFPPAVVAYDKVTHLTYYSCDKITSASFARFLKLYPNTRVLSLDIPEMVSTIARIYEDESPCLDRLCEFSASSHWKYIPSSCVLEHVMDRLTDFPGRVAIREDKVYMCVNCCYVP